MSNWKKIIFDGSQAELRTLRLSGTDETVSIFNPEFTYPSQDFWLRDFSSDNNAWKTNPANLNAGLTPWLSQDRNVEVESADAFPHKHFDISGQSPETSGVMDSTTGPNHGINNTGQTPNQTGMTLPQTTDTNFLYTETSDSGNFTYSITSPLLDLTLWTTKKLVFYFYMFGSNCGNFKVYTSTSNDHITGPPREFKYTANGTGLEFGDTLAGPVTELAGQQQTDNSSNWHRAEVNLASTTTPPTQANDLQGGYIWIVYESGDDDPTSNPNSIKADFAIGSLFLETSGYSGPITVDVLKPSLSVVSNAIKFYGLPTSDPEVAGALWQKPGTNLNSAISYIMISDGLQ